MVRINTALLVSGIVVSLSGFVLQVHYHLMKGPDCSAVFGLDRAGWNSLHAWSSVGFLIAVIGHLWRHRKWVRGVVRRRLFAKNRLAISLLLVATTTIATGLIVLFSGSFIVVEIHDKVAILFFILVFVHAIQRKIL